MDTLTDILHDAGEISYAVRGRALTAYETAANSGTTTDRALAAAREVVTKAEEGMKMFSEGKSHAQVANRIGQIADVL